MAGEVVVIVSGSRAVSGGRGMKVVSKGAKGNSGDLLDNLRVITPDNKTKSLAQIRKEATGE